MLTKLGKRLAGQAEQIGADELEADFDEDFAIGPGGLHGLAPHLQTAYISLLVALKAGAPHAAYLAVFDNLTDLSLSLLRCLRHLRAKYHRSEWDPRGGCRELAVILHTKDSSLPVWPQSKRNPNLRQDTVANPEAKRHQEANRLMFSKMGSRFTSTRFPFLQNPGYLVSAPHPSNCPSSSADTKYLAGTLDDIPECRVSLRELPHSNRGIRTGLSVFAGIFPLDAYLRLGFLLRLGERKTPTLGTARALIFQAIRP
ncbi:hypothetical protein R3P38DRAFT_2804271 [Favolaschia claudopus]|uniref:Uncharacterized protein n=1 Tax=Favolaschia claudopus TaxID=2862362 RepID=A0AAV9ZQE1_9AGAR